MSADVPTDDVLANQVELLWQRSINPNTAHAYRVGLKHLQTFLALRKVPLTPGVLPPVSEDTLGLFVSYCHQNLKLNHNTIKLYLAGIRFHYLKAGHTNPLADTPRLHYILRGIQKSQANTTTAKRLPITFSILQQMSDRLLRGMFSPYTDILLQAMCTMAFFGFLRCGEFTAQNLDDTDVILLHDIAFASDNQSYILTLRSSKTDPFRHGVPIQIFSNTSLCPVKAMTAFLGWRNSLGTSPTSPLFIDHNRSVITRNQFLGYIKHTLSVVGLDQAKYSGHSFRIGAGTTAAEKGVEDHLIQTLGRWSSNCYTRYIHTSSNMIQRAQCTMSSK